MIAAPSLSHPQLFAPRIADSRGRRPPLPSRRRRLLLLSLPRICAVHTSAAPRPPPIGSPPPPPPPPTATLYDVLGVAAGATASEIKAAYRRMARACHPDVVKDASADEFMRVHAAYATLSDPEKRADYDRRLAVLGRIRLTPATARGGNYPPFYGYTRRSWETDQCW